MIRTTHTHTVFAARSGKTSLRICLAVIAAGLCGAGGWYFLDGREGELSEELLTHKVVRGAFTLDVTEDGEISSGKNVEIRCDVKSNNTPGTAILEIVPEGSRVENGDLLCKLDSSALQQEWTKQQIQANTSKAEMVEAQNAYEQAKIARESYEDGEFKELETEAARDCALAEQDVEFARDQLQFSEKMLRKGYARLSKTKAARYALKAASLELNLAQTKLEVLRKYTKAVKIKELDTEVSKAEAKWKSGQSSHQLDLEKLKDIEAQIDKCVIKAPQAGQVVYASIRRGWDNDVIIEEGTLVRERQVIIRLPDPETMQVEAKINEARIDLVKVGMPVTVRVDAFSDEKIAGTVIKVNEYPEPRDWSTNRKQFLTVIKLQRVPEGVRTGMNSKVQIHVEKHSNVVQVPVQAVVEHQGKHYCLLKTGNGLARRAVEIGSTNDEFVVVNAGVAAGNEVVVNARKYWDETIDATTPVPAGPMQQLTASVSPNPDAPQ